MDYNAMQPCNDKKSPVLPVLDFSTPDVFTLQGWPY